MTARAPTAECYAMQGAQRPGLTPSMQNSVVYWLRANQDGECAGSIDKAFDLRFIESLTAQPRWAAQYSIEEPAEQVGTQGAELLMWLAMCAALGSSACALHVIYRLPISNTASGLMLLKPAW